MPLFIGALIPALVAWGSRALAVYGLSRLFSEQSVEELQQMFFDWAVAEVVNRAGIQLDPAAPFSDASMAGAVSQKLGVSLRSLKEPAMIREDLDNYAAELISTKSGYQISSVTNPASLRADFERVAMAIMTDRLGIPVGVVGSEFSVEAVRENVLSWAKAELLANVGGETGFAVQEIIQAGGLEAVANDLNSRLSAMGSIEAVTSRQLAVKVAEKMASNAVADFGRVAASYDKKNRKRMLNRAAQQKFRAAHGNRQIYVPLGMTAAVNEGGG